MGPKPKTIRDAAFGQRFSGICDNNPNVPPSNYGRLAWFEDQFKKRFNEKVSKESVRKWLAGEVKPAGNRLLLLARLLDVNEGWLAYGLEDAPTPRDRRLMHSESDGAVLTVAGLIKLAGGNVTFPLEEDVRAKRDGVDLYAVIKGATYSMHITAGHVDGDKVKFALPSNNEFVMQICLVALSDFAVQLIEIPAEAITEKGHRRGASIEVELTLDECQEYEIKSLRARF